MEEGESTTAPQLTKPGMLGRGNGHTISVPAVCVGVQHGCFRPVAEGGFEGIQSAVFWGRRWALDLDELLPQ